ncbi:MAG: Dak phosphatase [Pseudonocardiales bacterium]|nr:Dak phosphatase [Pseudonocardiales bacterium]
MIRRRVPGATSARTRCTFGFHRRWVRRWECETDMPKPGPLPQTSQTLATVASLVDLHGERVRRMTFENDLVPGQQLGNLGSLTAAARAGQTGPRPARTAAPGSRPSILRQTGSCRAYPTSGVDVLEALDADGVRRWSRAAVESLNEHRTEIDDLNVFPVPDGDTGTNLALTMTAADDALRADAAVTAGDALRVLATGAVHGARGNSGVIMSQILRGLAEAAAGCAVLDGRLLGNGLRRGADGARDAVAEPVEGTILTVARAAADAAETGAALGDLARSVVAAAEIALAGTREQLPALSRAGVVDAGGRGLVLLLDALECTITGLSSRLAPPRRAGRRGMPPRSVREAGSVEFGYEVQYLLDAPDEAVATLRSELTALGDSVAIVGTGAGVWNVHAHVNDAGAALEAGVEAGRPHRISVVRFADQPPAADSGGTAIVAVAPGDGMGHLFEAEGVRVVDGRRPSTSEVLAAVRATGAAEVVLLPYASQVTGVAEDAAAAARGEGIRVTVVPTRSPVQGLAAVAVHDPARRFDDDVVAMAEAAAATRFAEVTIAEGQSLTSVGICQKGDVLGLIDGEVVEIGRGLVAVVFAITDRLLGVGVELMTVLVGSDAPPGIGELVAGHVQERAPFTDVTVYTGGQPNYPLIIGVE